uniref:Uncharacterized protein n=1 Tax=Parascaris univalens TaxID=6257 RepID=A0A914ZQ70_PARUN
SGLVGITEKNDRRCTVNITEVGARVTADIPMNGGHVLHDSASEISTMKTSLCSQDDYACYAAPQFTSRNGVLQDSYVSPSGVVVNNKGGTTGRPSSDLYLPRKRRKPKTR